MKKKLDSKNKLFIFLFFLILLIYLGLKFLFPQLLATQLKKSLQEQMKIDLRIGSFDFEPINLSFNLEQIILNQSQTIKNLSIQLSLKGILKKQLIISGIEVEGINLNLVRTEKGYQLKNMNFPPDEKENKHDIKSQKDSSGVDWKLQIVQLKIINSSIIMDQSPLMKIDYIQLKNLTSDGLEGPLNFKSRLQVENSVIEFSGHAENYLKMPRGVVDFKVKNFNLNFINQFLKGQLGELSGDFNSDGQFSFDGSERILKFNSKLQNFKLYSLDKKTVDYYLQELSLREGSLVENKQGLQLSVNKLDFERFLLSMPVKKFNKLKKRSRYSSINLQEIKFYYPFNTTNKNQPLSLVIYQKHGRLVKLSQKMVKGKKNLVLNINDLDLLPFSETFANFMGYHINGGKLNLKYQSKTKHKQVDGSAQIILKQFKINDQNEKGIKTNHHDSIPLPTAISLIKNDDGVIELEFNISGNEEDPNFGFYPMLKQGIGAVLLSKFSSMVAIKAATRFLPLLVSSIPFSPANALLLINGGYKFLTKPRFQNLQFQAKSTQLSKESETNLGQFVKFLKSNKKINFELCPVANLGEGKEDEPAQIKMGKEESLDLAEARINQMKKFFNQHSEVAGQIHFCRPQIVDETSEHGTMNISL